jgi:ATP-dependent DNA helicase PIF1
MPKRERSGKVKYESNDDEKEHKRKRLRIKKEEDDDDNQVKEGGNELTLSPEQKAVLDMIITERKSIFFTGAAGTGKSFLLKEIIRSLGDLFLPEEIAITASTGIAACNIGGCTVHKFAGIGLGKDPANVLIMKVKNNTMASNRWRQTKILIIDESMVVSCFTALMLSLNINLVVFSLHDHRRVI